MIGEDRVAVLKVNARINIFQSYRMSGIRYNFDVCFASSATQMGNLTRHRSKCCNNSLQKHLLTNAPEQTLIY